MVGRNSLPSSFNWYPLDSHVCYLRFGSSLSGSRQDMTPINLQYNPESKNIILEYDVRMEALSEEENMPIPMSPQTNYSTAGIKISFTRLDI